MARNPKLGELQETVTTDVREALAILNALEFRGERMERDHSEAVKRALTRASAAMAQYDWVIRGGSQPKIGD